MAVVTHLRPICELASRTSGGIKVTLLWNRRSDELRVCVADSHTSVYFELHAPADKALDVFYHPYAYASIRGIVAGPTRAVASEPEHPQPRAA